MDKGVGCFVVDNEEELKAVDKEAASRGITQKIMLRLTPGIDPHTDEAISTGKVDLMFGVAIETGQAETFTASALGMKHYETYRAKGLSLPRRFSGLRRERF